MTSFMDYYRQIRKAKTERKSPRWQLASHAAIDKLPLTGRPKEYCNPDGVRSMCVVMRHRYRPNEKEIKVAGPFANTGKAHSISRALNRRENATQFPRYIFIVKPVEEETKQP